MEDRPLVQTVVVFGSGYAEPGSELFQLAYDVGRVLAQAGYVLANGGYGGTMLASAQGASEAGGHVIGVTCSAFGRSGPNDYVQEERLTSCLDERLADLISLGDAYVVLSGGTGTLLELAKVWELANKKRGNPIKPICVMGDFWMPVIETVKQQDPACVHLIQRVDRPDDIVAYLKALS